MRPVRTPPHYWLHLQALVSSTGTISPPSLPHSDAGDWALGTPHSDTRTMHSGATPLLLLFKVQKWSGRQLDGSLKPLEVSRDALRAEITYDTLARRSQCNRIYSLMTVVINRLY